MEWQFGNLTSQAASNLNLSDFDHFVCETLGLDRYVRYVDDAIIICNDKNKLINALPKIAEKLKETHQYINTKKTRIDTAYHGVSFLGKVSYPYGYQKPKKTTIIRTYYKGYNIEFDSSQSLLSKVNSQIGSLKRYNCRKLILNYSKILESKTGKYISFNTHEQKFVCHWGRRFWQFCHWGRRFWQF